MDKASAPTPQYSDTTPEAPAIDNRSPRLKDFGNKLVAINSPHSFEAEQFRSLRTNIMFAAEKQNSPRSILITSTHPGDGKSFVAANLAATIAQSIDRHVLLVDCDLRRPSIDTFFNLGEGLPGLSDYLMRGTPLSQLLVRTALARLSILPGGATPANPSELLSSNRMSALVQELQRRYDDRYIIFDSPPPQLAAETVALAKYVEGIILVVKIGHTEQDAALEVVNKLGKANIIGVVANWLSQRAVGYFGAGKYGKYSYYRKSKD
jgi:exopolysaccharide/PEP-CTERM locus tyrosine autokinase